MDLIGNAMDAAGDAIGDLGNPLALAFIPLLEESIEPVIDVLAPEAGKQVFAKMCEKFSALSSMDGLEEKCVGTSTDTLKDWVEEIRAWIPDVKQDIGDGFKKVLVVLLKSLLACIEAIIGMLKEQLSGCCTGIQDMFGCDPLNADDVAADCFSTLMEFLKETLKKKMDEKHIPDAVQGMISLDASPDDDIGPLRVRGGGEGDQAEAPEQQNLETE
eukprot:gnl/MRDRNA2_/MRDRNA2_99264_c0_seq1.p1 gnl/MRDRNA2_/MRDRNA2_99264_c0~~gnl/MRDRNA2_/MRDRNA2_99264_c0_seq1.p1  ORF type:complete len:216 (-),score=64.62 gnl/MRDRNA2_/MRDRNA2_99264_c0_seq1:53-700(-)